MGGFDGAGIAVNASSTGSTVLAPAGEVDAEGFSVFSGGSIAAVGPCAPAGAPVLDETGVSVLSGGSNCAVSKMLTVGALVATGTGCAVSASAMTGITGDAVGSVDWDGISEAQNRWSLWFP